MNRRHGFKNVFREVGGRIQNIMLSHDEYFEETYPLFKSQYNVMFHIFDKTSTGRYGTIWSDEELQSILNDMYTLNEMGESLGLNSFNNGKMLYIEEWITWYSKEVNRRVQGGPISLQGQFIN